MASKKAPKSRRAAPAAAAATTTTSPIKKRRSREQPPPPPAKPTARYTALLAPQRRSPLLTLLHRSGLSAKARYRIWEERMASLLSDDGGPGFGAARASVSAAEWDFVVVEDNTTTTIAVAGNKKKEKKEEKKREEAAEKDRLRAIRDVKELGLFSPLFQFPESFERGLWGEEEEEEEDEEEDVEVECVGVEVEKEVEDDDHDGMDVEMVPVCPSRYINPYEDARSPFFRRAAAGKIKLT